MSRIQSGSGANRDRILVVDDDEAARYPKSRILRQAGFTVIEADSGAAALRSVKQDNPDLVLLDMRLPDMGGMEVCRRIKADSESAAVPVLQMSASMHDAETRIAGLDGGADGYITTPIDPMLLVATIRAFLRTRKAEQAVRERALQWQATFDAIGDGIALLNSAGEVVGANRALSRLLEAPESGLIGKKLDDLLPAAAGADTVTQHLQDRERHLIERTVGDRIFSLSIDPSPERNIQGVGPVCIVCDITERKTMNECLRQTQKLESIGLLAGGVAHDFNNLLTGIIGNASLGIEQPYDVRQVERAFQDIIRASERAADLTRQLLAYSGKGKFLVEKIDLTRSVIRILPLVKTSFSRKIKVALNMAEDLPAVEADRTQLEQIIMNLLINASEAIGENAGTIAITTKSVRIGPGQAPKFLSDLEVRGDYVLLEVTDDGEGMSEETVRQIFDPFFTTKFMGRGLGLSAVLGILRSHKGAVRVTSSPGAGAKFELLFPSTGAFAGAEAEAKRAPSHSQAGRGTVLVIDDEAIVRDFFRSALQRHGFEVVEAENGAEGVRIFSGDPHRFIGILLDVVMPVMSGKEALPLLLEANPNARIVITSGQMEEAVRRDLQGWPIAGFIQKPCATQQLVEKVQACCMNPEAAKAESQAGR